MSIKLKFGIIVVAFTSLLLAACGEGIIITESQPNTNKDSEAYATDYVVSEADSSYDDEGKHKCHQDGESSKPCPPNKESEKPCPHHDRHHPPIYQDLPECEKCQEDGSCEKCENAHPCHQCHPGEECHPPLPWEHEDDQKICDNIELADEGEILKADIASTDGMRVFLLVQKATPAMTVMITDIDSGDLLEIAKLDQIHDQNQCLQQVFVSFSKETAMVLAEKGAYFSIKFDDSIVSNKVIVKNDVGLHPVDVSNF